MKIIFSRNFSIFYKVLSYFLIFFVLFFSISKPAFSDEISDAEDLYGRCIDERKEALATCRKIYLGALEKFLEEVWTKFLKRHEILGNERNLNGKNIILDDVIESQKKWN